MANNTTNESVNQVSNVIKIEGVITSISLKLVNDKLTNETTHRVFINLDKEVPSKNGTTNSLSFSIKSFIYQACQANMLIADYFGTVEGPLTQKQLSLTCRGAKVVLVRTFHEKGEKVEGVDDLVYTEDYWQSQIAALTPSTAAIARLNEACKLD
uniref:Coat protein n=1 Tax=Geladintestivirus 2 TaxID=3233134 RepID=A0AAU8MLQ0_9CAUD